MPGWPRAARGAAVFAALAVPCALAAGVASAPAHYLVHYLDGAPLGHTGGFGEPSCHECHFDAPLNEPEGDLTVSFQKADSGAVLVRVVLARPGLEAGGFQLAARFADGSRAGEQAGSLRAVDERVEVAAHEETGVAYAGHGPDGTAPTAPDTVAWTVAWTPPEGGSSGSDAPVRFHVAANAANGDLSEFGDHVYLVEATWPPEPGGK